MRVFELRDWEVADQPHVLPLGAHAPRHTHTHLHLVFGQADAVGQRLAVLSRRE